MFCAKPVLRRGKITKTTGGLNRTHSSFQARRGFPFSFLDFHGMDRKLQVLDFYMSNCLAVYNARFLSGVMTRIRVDSPQRFREGADVSCTDFSAYLDKQ